MHPSMQQRADGVAAIHARRHLEMSAIYAACGKELPVQQVRFQVISVSENISRIVERSTGKVKGIRFSWKAAINCAQILEAQADGKKINIEGWGE